MQNQKSFYDSLYCEILLYQRQSVTEPTHLLGMSIFTLKDNFLAIEC